MATEFLGTEQGRKIAFHKTEGVGPGVVFLGGFMSDMEGTKAIHLEQWALRNERAFIRFDYSGHGQSSGAFDEGSIGDWAEDAAAVLTHLTTGPQILVGSSMGGWISAILARNLASKVGGFVGIAAAPDFTEDSMWAGFSDKMKQELTQNSRVELPSEYDAPYVITKRLIEDGRENLVLRDRISAPFPVRLLQGSADADVKMSVALNLFDKLEGPDIRLTFVKEADHRFSDAGCLRLIEESVEQVIQQVQHG